MQENEKPYPCIFFYAYEWSNDLQGRRRLKACTESSWRQPSAGKSAGN